MKKTLLLFTLFAAFATKAQNPVTAYLPQNNSVYSVYDTATPLSQSAAGANMNWDFTSVVETGTAHFDVEPATPDMTTQFPNTTDYVYQAGDSGDSYLFVAQSGSNLSLTGTDANGILLSYTNNAFVGTLPMAYGYTQTDAIAGTYEFDTYSGPFTGTITTTVDAYGTLTFMAGNPLQVTRVKTVQNMSLTYMGIPNIGTGVQTTYSYYSQEGIMQFTSSTLTISAPLAGINETLSTILGYQYTELRAPENTVAEFSVYPNPSNGIVNIKSENAVDAVQIADVSGKIVMAVKNTRQLDISGLSPGIYVATITSGTNTSIQKLVKK